MTQTRTARATPDTTTAFLAGMRAAYAIVERERHIVKFRYAKALECETAIRRAFLDGGAPPEMVDEVFGKEPA